MFHDDGPFLFVAEQSHSIFSGTPLGGIKINGQLSSRLAEYAVTIEQGRFLAPPMTEMRRASTARRLCHRRRSAKQTKTEGLGTSRFHAGLFGCGIELDERHVQRVEAVTAAG